MISLDDLHFWKDVFRGIYEQEPTQRTICSFLLSLFPDGTTTVESLFPKGNDNVIDFMLWLNTYSDDNVRFLRQYGIIMWLHADTSFLKKTKVKEDMRKVERRWGLVVSGVAGDIMGCRKTTSLIIHKLASSIPTCPTSGSHLRRGADTPFFRQNFSGLF
jgi:hypothetical protein